MEHPTEGDVESGSDEPAEHLQAQIRIEPNPEAECQVIDSGSRDGSVDQAIVTREGDASSTCRAAVTGEDGEQHLLHGPVTPRCICPVFSRHDCISTIESVRADELIVSLVVPDRNELVSIVSSLRAIDATPRLLQLTGTDFTSGESVIELEADSVTDKQREAVRVAVESGYYETPRRANLGDLANQLDVTRSAVSQRLIAVESKLITGLFEADGGGRFGE